MYKRIILLIASPGDPIPLFIPALRIVYYYTQYKLGDYSGYRTRASYQV